MRDDRHDNCKVSTTIATKAYKGRYEIDFYGMESSRIWRRITYFEHYNGVLFS